MIRSSTGRRTLHPLAGAMFVALAVAACTSAATPAPTPAPTAVPTPGSGASASAALVNVAEAPSLGAYLTGVDGLSLYLFTKDTAETSNCSGQCASNWPPLVVPAGETPTGGTGVTGTLATIERADGTRQVTYNGIPLYYWAADTKAGEMLGQGVNGVWFLVAPTATAAGGSITGGVDQPAAGTSPAPATAAPGATSQGGSSGSAESVAISGFAFAPASISVSVGATVTWTNDDAAPHTVTAAGGTFDSGNLSKGQTFSRTFDSAGTFAYRCTIHSSMTGTVTVTDPTAY